MNGERPERSTANRLERLYRIGLRCYPASFRARHGHDMVELFRDGLFDAFRRGGTLRMWRKAIRGFRDVALSGVAERISGAPDLLSEPGRPSKPTLSKRIGVMFADVRYAVRSALGSPGFAVVTILTFALATGAFATVFGAVDHLLLRPLPYPEADRIAFVGERVPETEQLSVTSYPVLAHLRDDGDLFEDLAIYNLWLPTLTEAGDPTRLEGQVVTASFFDVLGQAPVLGRTFTAEDDVQDAARTAVISHRLWSSRFGSDPGLVGSDITLSGQPYTVIGVMPADFEGPEGDRVNDVIDVWRTSRGSWTGNSINGRFLRGVGRIDGAWDDARVESGVGLAESRLREANPDWSTTAAIGVIGLQDHVTRPIRSLLLLTLVAVMAALAAITANLVSVFLTRALKREPEFVVRSALGATRRRIYSLILSENLVLGCIGAALGIGSAAVILPIAAGMGPDSIPRAHSLGVNAWTGSIALLTALAIALVASLAVVPSMRRSGSQAVRSLTGGSRSRRRFQSLLLITQVGLSLALVAGSSLLLRSFRSLSEVEMGFDAEGVLGVQLDVSGSQGGLEVMVDEILREAGSVAGVETVGVVGSFPQHGLNNFGISFGIGNVTAETPRDSITPGGAQYRHVGGSYLDAIGAERLGGRFFELPDFRADATPTAVVNREFESRYFGEETAVGETVTLQTGPVEIVGVIENVRYGFPGEDPEPELYVPRAHGMRVALSTTFLTLRTSGLSPELSRSIREAIHRVDPSLPVELMSLESLVSDTLAGPRFNLWFMTTLAAIALVVALVGIFGVTANLVTNRRREMGIRMALGATTREVETIVLGWGAKIAGIGITLGLILTIAGGRYVESLLFGVRPTDPTSLAATIAILFGATLLAAYLPARRAGQTDPTTALRSD